MSETRYQCYVTGGQPVYSTYPYGVGEYCVYPGGYTVPIREDVVYVQPYPIYYPVYPYYNRHNRPRRDWGNHHRGGRIGAVGQPNNHAVFQQGLTKQYKSA